MLYHHFIWDFDGTLFDSYPHVAAAYHRALADFGKSADPEELMAHLKISFHAAHDYVGADEALIERFKEYEADMTLEPVVFPYEGVVELIRDSHAAGARHYLFTHRSRQALDYLEREGILECFTGWVTKSDRDRGIFVRKPKPDSILWLLKEYGVEPSDCAMVGDREIDVCSGIAAGTQGILFDEFRSLGQTRAQHRVYTVAELRELIFS